MLCFGLDAFVFLSLGLGFQVFIDGMRALTVDVDFLHQREGHAVVEAAELGDFLVGAWLLVGELVAGEADDDQTLVLVLLIEGFQAVVLRRETALRGGVDNHQDLAFILCEVHFFSLVVQGFEIKDFFHSSFSVFSVIQFMIQC